MIKVHKQGRLIGTSAVCYREVKGRGKRYIRKDNLWFASDHNWKIGDRTARSIEIVEWP
jgi:hypothetical protein